MVAETPSFSKARPGLFGPEAALDSDRSISFGGPGGPTSGTLQIHFFQTRKLGSI